MMTRETLGRVVRQTWVAWASEQPDPKPSWLTPWETLDAGQREVDMRIADAVVSFACDVSRAELEAREAEVPRLRAALAERDGELARLRAALSRLADTARRFAYPGDDDGVTDEQLCAALDEARALAKGRTDAQR